ncbi:hypothetical protein B9Z40_10770 [Limnohabitans sp. 15K]|nr:hypothetical protein B9Z40_10770 [Limnohabitans sp. 15K]
MEPALRFCKGAHFLNRSSPLSTAASSWVWLLLGAWLVYSFGTLAWYLMNDPAFMASICKVT